MTRGIDVDPVRGLREAIEELSIASGSVERRINSLGLSFRELDDLLGSETIEKLERYRSAQHTVSEWRKLVKEVDAYARAERMMRLRPESWRNADEAIAWVGKVRERNRSLFRRHQAAVDEARGLRNPRAQHIIDLQRRYGSADAAMILDAERQAAVDEGARRIARGKAEGAYNFRRDRWAKFQREYLDDTVRYGGGAEGRSMAERERIRKSDLLRSRAMRMRQLNAYRQFPWIKTLVDAGIIEKKEIPKISKNLANMSKAPIIGKFLKHPSLLPLAALGVATTLLERSDRANRVVQKWSAAEAVYGTPSGRFDSAARLAGFESKEAVNKFFSQFVGEYGEASVDAVMTHIGAMLNAAKPGIQRDAILKAFKMDAQMGRAAMFMAGHRPKKSDETAALLGILGDVETQGFSSDAGIFDWLQSAFLWLPGVKPTLARASANPKETMAIAKAAKFVAARPDPISVYKDVDSLTDSLARWILGKPEEAKAAAESLEAVESAGNAVSSVTNGGDTSVSFSIGNLEINANDAQALAEELIKVGSGRSGLDIMEAFDRKEIA